MDAARVGRGVRSKNLYYDRRVTPCNSPLFDRLLSFVIIHLCLLNAGDCG